MSDTIPTLAGFLSFVRSVMGVPQSALPDNAPVLQESLTFSLEIVNQTLNQVSPRMYTAAVYNLAGDNLINYAPDQSGQIYFKDIRTSFNIGGFVSGVIQSSSDNGSGDSLVVQKAAENFTLSDLQNLKTPYGRQYLAIAQRYGTLWGLT